MNGHPPGPTKPDALLEAAARAICAIAIQQANAMQQKMGAPAGVPILVKPLPAKFLADQVDRQWPAFVPHALAALDAAQAVYLAEHRRREHAKANEVPQPNVSATGTA